MCGGRSTSLEQNEVNFEPDYRHIQAVLAESYIRPDIRVETRFKAAEERMRRARGRFSPETDKSKGCSFFIVRSNRHCTLTTVCVRVRLAQLQWSVTSGRAICRVRMVAGRDQV